VVESNIETIKDIELNYIEKKTSKSIVIDKLSILIEESDDKEIRKECIESFGEIAITDEKIFQILEYCIVSDESSKVRRAALKVLIELFFHKGKKLYYWVFENESSNRVRCETDGKHDLLRNLASRSKQGVDNYYGENCILATETTLPFYIH